MILERSPLSPKLLDSEIARSQAKTRTQQATEKLNSLNNDGPVTIQRILHVNQDELQYAGNIEPKSTPISEAKSVHLSNKNSQIPLPCPHETYTKASTIPVYPLTEDYRLEVLKDLPSVALWQPLTPTKTPRSLPPVTPSACANITHAPLVTPPTDGMTPEKSAGQHSPTLSSHATSNTNLAYPLLPLKPNADLRNSKHPSKLDQHINDHRDHEGPPHTINKSWDTQLKAATEEHSYGLSGISEQANYQNPNDLEIRWSHSSIALQQNPSNHDTEMDIDPSKTHILGKAPTLSPNRGTIH